MACEKKYPPEVREMANNLWKLHLSGEQTTSIAIFSCSYRAMVRTSPRFTKRFESKWRILTNDLINHKIKSPEILFAHIKSAQWAYEATIYRYVREILLRRFQEAQNILVVNKYKAAATLLTEEGSPLEKALKEKIRNQMDEAWYPEWLNQLSAFWKTWKSNPNQWSIVKEVLGARVVEGKPKLTAKSISAGGNDPTIVKETTLHKLPFWNKAIYEGVSFLKKHGYTTHGACRILNEYFHLLYSTFWTSPISTKAIVIRYNRTKAASH
ncbi:MAG TPA: hypothetical protein PK876_06840 [Elusimicrobiota bacterium]|nr:hypothetical protein [Elusimicrobiota bacterium]